MLTTMPTMMSGTLTTFWLTMMQLQLTASTKTHLRFTSLMEFWRKRNMNSISGFHSGCCCKASSTRTNLQLSPFEWLSVVPAKEGCGS